MDDADIWACTQAMTGDADHDGQSHGENERRVDDFGCIVLNDMDDSERYVLKEGDNTIGRHPLNHIYIEHPSVSMNHAVIQCDSDGVVLLDKGSLNKTRLNKKILKKNVAYFLDENALLIFGEVQANYYVNTESSETIDAKASNDTLVQNPTENGEFSVPKLTDAAIATSNSSCTKETPDETTACSVSLVTENRSTHKTQTTVLNNIVESEKSYDHNVRSESISPSPSDEFLLDAISQIETNGSNENVSEFLFPNEDTCSPVMDLTEAGSVSHILSMDNNIESVSDIHGLYLNSNPETGREDTPSPVMDLGHYTDVVPEETREDTPSPVMDLGPLVDYVNGLSTQETITQNNNTQLMGIKDDILENCTQIQPISTVNDFNEDDDDIFISGLQNIESFETISKDALQINKTNNLSVSKSTKTTTNSLNKVLHNFCEQLPENPSIPTCSQSKIENVQEKYLLEQKVNTFEADDDDIFNDFIQNEFISQSQISTKTSNEDFFKCSQNKVSISKTNENKKTSQSIDEQETQLLQELSPQPSKNFPSTSNIGSTSKSKYSNQIPEIDDDDFFNCPTQKVSISKKITAMKKLSQTIIEEETQPLQQLPPQPSKTCPTMSNTGSTNKSENSNEVPKIVDNDDDFFNCPTQKVSISKKISEMKKLSPTIHEQETQPLIELPPQSSKTCPSTSSNIGSNSKFTNLNEIPKIVDDDDFFNCPTQKVSISQKLTAMKKFSQSIHEQETQPLPDLPPQRTKAYPSTSNTCSTTKHEYQVLKMDDDDFFNCPTQKVSISKKFNSMKKTSESIHEQETQPLQLSKDYPNTSNASSTSKLKYSNQAPEIDDDDFFNCPTQKVSNLKKVNAFKVPYQSINEQETQPLPNLSPQKKLTSKANEIKNTSQSIHEQETQPIPDLSSHSSKIYPSTSNTGSSNKNKYSNQVPEVDDEDFFNFPTQKISISKKINSMNRPYQSINEQETQPLPDLSLQKVSTSKKTNEVKKLSPTIHEQETQPLQELLPEPRKICPSISNTGSNSKSKYSNQYPGIDDEDFFNCPTQKVSISKNISEIKKLSPIIHEQETQPIPDLTSQPSKVCPNTSNTGSSSINKYSNHVPEVDDDDFFNFPTQKVSILKKMNSMNKRCQSMNEQETQPLLNLSFSNNISEIKKLSPTIHEQETQPLKELPPQPSKACQSTSNTGFNSKSKYSNQIPEIDDEDFFNCPTQRVSISKKMNTLKRSYQSINEEKTQPLPDLSPQISSISKNINKTKSLSSTIHEQETQPLQELPPQSSKACPSTSNTGSTSKSKYSNQIPEIDDDDFFNCPTQKVSITKKLNTPEKSSQSIHEQETQPLQELPPQSSKACPSTSNTGSTSKSKYSNQIPEIDDDDFFNCPTQKVSITKKLNTLKKSSQSICEQETQPLQELPPQPSKACPSTPNTGSTSKSKYSNQIPEIDDDDFFNCPTQKVSITKKLNTLKKSSQSICEQETQPLHELPPQPSKTCPSTSGTGFTSETNNDDFNRVFKLVGDLFDSPTQSLPDNLQPSNLCNIGSNTHVTSKNKDLVLASEKDDDFYDHPTQPHPGSLQSDNSCTNSVNSCTTSVNKDLTTVSVDDADVNFLSKPTVQLSSLATDNKKQNVFNLNEAETQELSSETNSAVSITKMNSSGKKKQNKENIFGCTNQKTPTKIIMDNYGVSNVVSNHTDMDMLQKSSLIHSNSIDKPATRSKNQNLFKSSITNKKQIIRVRKDLHKSVSVDVENIPLCVKSNENTGIKNLKTSAKSKNVSPGRPRITSDVVSIKQEPVDPDEPIQHQGIYYLRHKDRSLRMNETIFSPLNEPSTSTNPLQQHQTTVATQSNVDIPNCQPSTSSDISSQWKSFWNQKKGKSTASTNGAIVKKERYQTRANTKRDNSQELSRKRKQDNVSIEVGNKRSCNVEAENRLNPPDNRIKPPIQGTPDVVVTFSYLKSRNLQDMKLFIERTGGYVTDEITECTVLVTDKIRCTMKTLSAIAKGCPIVEANWVKHSYTVKMFQDVDQFIISDKDAERKYKFKLKESLARAQNSRLLEGYTVMVTPSVKPGLKDMKVIITCAGGDFVVNWPKERRLKELIVTCDQDRRRWKSFWDNENAKIIDSDALVIAIITQHLNV